MCVAIFVWYAHMWWERRQRPERFTDGGSRMAVAGDGDGNIAVVKALVRVHPER